MRITPLLLVFFLFAFLVGSARPAHAQPTGSYQQTCRSVNVTNNTLVASCRDQGGHYRNTTLAGVGQCIPGSILNDKGTLRCSTAAIPPGSYQATCGSVHVENGILYAACTQIGSGRRDTTLANYAGCLADIGNVNGYLACDQGDNPGPSGTYRTTCRDRFLSYPTLSASCMDYYRNFKSTRLDISTCKLPVENHNGKLACGPQPRPTPTPAPDGFSKIVFYNCGSRRQPALLWIRTEANPAWSTSGIIPSGWVGNSCAIENANLIVPLPAGPSAFAATGSTCNNPNNEACIVMDQLQVIGNPNGPVVAHELVN